MSDSIPKEKMVELFANSGDPDQDLGLHCFTVTRLGVFSLQWVKKMKRQTHAYPYQSLQKHCQRWAVFVHFQNVAALTNTYRNYYFFFSCLQMAFPEIDGPSGEAWIAYSDISGLRFANLLVLDIENGTQFSVSQKDTGIFDHVRYIWVN